MVSAVGRFKPGVLRLTSPLSPGHNDFGKFKVPDPTYRPRHLPGKHMSRVHTKGGTTSLTHTAGKKYNAGNDSERKLLIREVSRLNAWYRKRLIKARIPAQVNDYLSQVSRFKGLCGYRHADLVSQVILP